MKTNLRTIRLPESAFSVVILAAALASVVPVSGQGVPKPASRVFRCPTEPPPGQMMLQSAGGGCGGGVSGLGWDGPGQNATTLFWHAEGTTGDLQAGQRAALIQAMQAWASVVRITFQELPVANANRSIDFNFLTGDHSVVEPQEAGDPDCPFNGSGDVLAHAAFPPGGLSTCGGLIVESFAGNVHFDDAELWAQDDGDGAAFSLTLVACHEIGHALGLVHAVDGCSDLMRPGFADTDTFTGLTANDINNIRVGYAGGTGAVITLNETGVWVARNFVGFEMGTQGAPFNAVSEGVAGVPPHSTGVAVHLQSASYNETLTISQNMILRAENGPVTIGRP